jgi:uncharacterized membrane protein YbhN (UPF0104 family)
LNIVARHWWQVLLQPKIVLPILLSAALLAFAFGISDLPQVFDRISRISIGTIISAFALALVYLVIKGLELRLLLGRLGIRPGWRRLAFAFVVSEMTITIPAGVFAQNYILQHTCSAGFVRSAAATTAMLIIELFIILSMLTLLGMPGWGWVRLMAMVVLAGLVPTIGFLASPDALAARLLARVRGERLKRIVRGIADVSAGLRELKEARTVLPALFLALGYLGALATAFTLIGRGTGLEQLGYFQGVAIYSFSLTVTLLMMGMLTQLGVIEVAGLGAATAFGYGPSEALALMLGFRLIWMGSIWLIGAPTAMRLRDALEVPPEQGAHAVAGEEHEGQNHEERA